MPAPSVVVPPQATAIPRLGKENIPPPAEPVRRLTRASRTRHRSPAAVLADSGTEHSIPVSSVDAHSLELQPVSPMFLDVEIFSFAVRPPIRIATKAMLDTGSSLSFISTRMFQHLPESIMELTSFTAQLADGSDLAVEKCCTVSFKLINGSHPNITCRVKCCVIRLPPQVDMLLGAPFHRDHSLQLEWRKGLVVFPNRSNRPTFSHSPPQYGPDSHLSVLDCQKAVRRGDRVFACVVRSLAGGEEAPTQLSPPDASATTVDNGGPKIAAITGDFADVFSERLPKGLPPQRAIEHNIDLMPGSKPAARPAYKISFADQAEMKTQLADLLASGSVQPSRSPYAAPVLFVKKKGTTALRMCCDFRLLNSQTIKSLSAHIHCPLRPMSLIDQLFGAQVYSKLDLRSGYYQIRVAAKDVAKTAFITSTGLYEWKVMPFGLCNAPATFQSLMNDLLRPFIGISCLCYLDDVLIFSKNIIEHDKHFREVLEAFRKSHLFVNPAKCALYQKEVTFLGHVISPNGVGMEYDKVAAIRTWPTPKNLTELRGFLGLASFYLRHCHSFSKIAVPLTDMLKKDKIFEWTKESTKAFEAIKDTLSSAPRPNRPGPKPGL